MARIIAPLDETVQNRDSKEDYIWDQNSSQRFREAKSHINNIHTLYLPHPNDQLVLRPDTASLIPGVGHALYAIKGDNLVPVRFHSTKLPQQCLGWSCCELEALSLVNSIDAEYNIL